MLVNNILVSNIIEQGERRKPAVGDQMLQAVIFHSDNLELSEQFDAATGYEKSVSNLSWSYASFLSAVRARTAI
jgi:glucoamylase